MSILVLEPGPLRQVYRIPSAVVYEFPQARVVSNDVKHSFLPLSRNISESGEKIMEELSRIDPWAASQFGLKKLAVQDFVMRLLYESSMHDALPQVYSSFIILSYTWHNSEWTPHPSLGDTQIDAGPLTPAMWSAFLSQRLSPSEGFWCDQLCIVQTSSHEKDSAIGAMDLLYKSARKVVVALEDIAITKEEMDALLDYDPFRCGNRSQQRIAEAFEKVVLARWFRRAWCLHEFLVSRNHTFLVPVGGEGGDGLVTIMRLDARFLDIMSDTFMKVNYSLYLNTKGTHFAPSNLTKQDANRLLRFTRRLHALHMAAICKTELINTDGSYMHMFSEIFSLGAFSISDKVSILLNVMNAGLSYSGSMSLTEEDCLRLATVVALASGDPTALTTNGGPVLSPDRKPETRWLRLPILINTMRGVNESFPKIGTDLAIAEQGLQLGMQFICTSADVTSPEPRFLSISRLLIDHRAMCKRPDVCSSFILDYLDDDDSYKDIRLYCIQALACALQLGAEWIYRVSLDLFANNLGLHFPMLEESLKDHWAAVNWALSLKFDQALGSDTGETWKVYEQANIGGDEELSLHDEHYLSNTTLTSSILSPEAHYWYSILLRIANKLVVVGFAAHATACAATNFAVQILHLSSAGDPLFVVFAPVCDQPVPDSCLNYCMPEMLANEEYWNLSRMWILKECMEDGTGRRFELVSKTPLIGTGISPEGERMGEVIIVG